MKMKGLLVTRNKHPLVLGFSVSLSRSWPRAARPPPPQLPDAVEKDHPADGRAHPLSWPPSIRFWTCYSRGSMCHVTFAGRKRWVGFLLHKN